MVTRISYSHKPMRMRVYTLLLLMNAKMGFPSTSRSYTPTFRYVKLVLKKQMFIPVEKKSLTIFYWYFQKLNI